MQHLAVAPAVLAALILVIPIVAIIGGIVAGIVRSLGRQRLAELAMRERIAAIERGIDPSKLSPLPVVDDHAQRAAAIKQVMAAAGLPLPPRRAALQNAQGWLLSGVIILAAGLGLVPMLMILPDANLILQDANAHRVWAIGLLPVFVGIAAIVCSVIVRKGAPADDHTPGPPSA
jgi:hypothetical protein